MEITTEYKGYVIRAFEREPERWRAEIRRTDATNLKIFALANGELTSITTSADALTADAAIQLAKQAIDAGGIR